MTIQIAKEIHCDGCGDWARGGATVKSIWRALSKEGWKRKGGEHWCDACVEERIKAGNDPDHA